MYLYEIYKTIRENLKQNLKLTMNKKCEDKNYKNIIEFNMTQFISTKNVKYIIDIINLIYDINCVILNSII